MKTKEPKLCPDCPMRSWIPEAVQRIKNRQHTRVKDQPSPLKICIELRRIAKEYGLAWNTCPYFPKTETLLLYTSSRG